MIENRNPQRSTITYGVTTFVQIVQDVWPARTVWFWPRVRTSRGRIIAWDLATSFFARMITDCSVYAPYPKPGTESGQEAGETAVSLAPVDSRWRRNGSDRTRYKTTVIVERTMTGARAPLLRLAGEPPPHARWARWIVSRDFMNEHCAQLVTRDVRGSRLERLTIRPWSFPGTPHPLRAP